MDSRRRGSIAAAALGLLALAVAACGPAVPTVQRSEGVPGPGLPAVPSSAATTEPSGPTAPATTRPQPVRAITWKQLTRGTESGTLTVPVDYADPSKGTFELYLVRHLAEKPKERIGSLLVNPGGPGFGGSDFAVRADSIYSQDLRNRFDIVGWDPRGTGKTTPAIDCITDYDRYFASTDITPDTPAERQQIVDLAREFQEACTTKNAGIVAHIGTNNSARDMNAIRLALGEDRISYFGFSYGSELGAAWATLFPETVRAAVLDGAADPTASFLDSGLQQAKGFEASIATFLAQCSRTRSCAFHNGGKAEAAFDALMLALDEKPVPTRDGRPPASRGMALTAVAQAMYSKSFWPVLERALAAAQNGEGLGLLDLYDQYFQRRSDGSYDNSLEAFQTISCMDSRARPTVAEDDADVPKYLAVAPRFAPGTTGSYFCTFYPPSIDPRVEITGEGAGPILVVGTTGDPATPLASTEMMARSLEQGVLLVVVADQHTGYGVNSCAYDQIDGYLIDLDVPRSGTRCG